MELLALCFLTAKAAAMIDSSRVMPLSNLPTDFVISRIPTSQSPLPLTDLVVTENVVQLQRKPGTSLSSSYIRPMIGKRKQEGSTYSRLSNGTANLEGVEAGEVFIAPITVGGQQFYVVIDTGSSDPWLAECGFACIDPDSGAMQAEEMCYFSGCYDPTQSSTYSVIANENFNISYADNEMLNGLMAYESMILAGIVVPKQEMGVVNRASWFGDGYSTGLVGFAYKTLTSAYPGTNASADTVGSSKAYNPLFTTMYTNNQVAPVFSLAIDRNQGGVLAIGGLPPVPHSPYFVSTPIVPIGVSASNGQVVYEFYTITIGGFAYSAKKSTQFNPFASSNRLKTTVTANQTEVIVDSGTSLVYLPDSLADAVAALFKPPGNYDSTTGFTSVSCNAVPPVFGVDIAGKVFYVNGADLIVPANSGQCICGVQRNNGGYTILGDVFMKNVLVVFDLGAEVLRFASREYLGLTDPSETASSTAKRSGM